MMTTPLRQVGLIPLLAGLLCLPANRAQANESPFHLAGYYKSFAVVYDWLYTRGWAAGSQLSTRGSVSNRLRLDAAYRATSWLSLDVSYDLAPRIQDPALFDTDPFGFSLNPFSYRVDDLEQYLIPDDRTDISSFAVLQNLDRASVSLRLPFADVYVGRQAIAWGTARVVNPTDILAPFAYTELDTEDRVGVDAIRARIPLGFMGEVDAGYVGGDAFALRRSAVFVRAKYYVARTDASIVLIDFQQNLLIGLDAARAVGGMGVWFEGAWVSVDAFTDQGHGSGDDYLRMSIGGDYNFSADLYGFVEYHYNQAGSNDAADYAGEITQTAYTEGTVYLLGRHYLIPGVQYQLSPLITGTLEVFVNLGDVSVSLTPSVEYNVAENVYLAAGAYVGLGASPSVGVGVPQVEFNSEFGSYPDMYFTSFRVYF